MDTDKSLTYEQIYNNLIEKIKSYHPNPNLELVRKAYDLAREAHGEQLRKSGEPYMVHPVSVAYILAELELDVESIVAGILHDVVEDTEFTKDDLATNFSVGIAEIVDGVTKLQAINYKSKEEAQAENYRKMFLAISKDYRVIIVKIADRLHNMRTLKYMIREKQIKIAQETIDIYAPISHKLGISKIKCELEDLSFRYLHPEEYYELAEAIELKQDERNEHINKIINDIKSKLDAVNISYQIDGRPKHFYSIYRKMVKQNKSLDQIHDLFAVRVLVNTNADCYAVLGIVNSAFYSVAGRFKDYISVKKENGYQSLHNTLIGPKGEPFEIQIRTYEMHKVSEYGVAAHWKYKEGIKRETNNSDDEKFAWLRSLLELEKDTNNNEEFLGAIKGDFTFYEDRVYCFTPAGDIVNLAKGATTIDFAYYIHSGVGNKMTGAKVNGKIVPIDYVLQNADRVDIITSKNTNGPNANWLKIVKTPQAKSKINQWFNALNKTENINKGLEVISAELKKRGYSYKDIVDEEMKNYCAEKFKFKSFESLVAGIGLGGIKDGAITNKIIERYEILHQADALKKKNEEIVQKIKAEQEKQTLKIGSNTKGVILSGVGFTEAKFSRCCSPLPGDDIVAFTTRGRGITVHRKDCVNVVNLDETEKARILNAQWADNVQTSYTTKLQLVCDYADGLFVTISNLFQTESISISDLNMRRVNDEVYITIEFSVKSTDELEKITNKLNSLPITKSVKRIAV